jgi:multiple sugar transport system substrate-binding protein
MRNRFRLPALAITGVLVVAACGSTTATSAPTGVATPAPTAAATAAPSGEAPSGEAASGEAPSGEAPSAGAVPEQGIDDGTKITMWSRAATETRVQSQVDEYNKTHKNQVELRLVPTDEYVGVVGNAATANELPDLFSADVVFMPNWTSQGLFMDITSRIDGLPGIENVGQAHIVASSWEGKKYGLPFIIDLSVWMYNKDLFRKAGLDPEKPPTNLKEFADAARAVQKLNISGTYGTYFGGNCGGCNVFTWWPIIWAEGGDVMNDEGTEAQLNSATAKEIYKTFGALWDEGVINPESIQEAGPTWTQPFPAGKVGIMPMPASLQESEGMPLDNLGVTAIAGTTKGESTFVGGDSIGLSKDSKHPDQAWNFITWMLGDHNQVEVVAKAGNVVARTDLANNQYSSADPRLVLFNKVAGEGETPFALHFNAAFNDPQSPWIQLFRSAVFEDADDAKIEQLNSNITSVLQGG